ncbi:preprotein translocase subunit SecA [Miltoncostaea oceani]|uniref:preprotein translocase subunit SecA n=1 Tax=Miltoncostaea oceani TaxID=2843216 RepID=UPI001C3DB4A5|nr:preprotein translocase subunit SecA [Miltoncostaea oceani]
MSTDLINKVLRVGEGRAMKAMQSHVARIGALEPEMEKLTDAELRAKTDEFRARIADGASVDDLVTEAFAVVREAGRRVLGMRLFDVQMIGAMVLNSGKVAEMKTGEGKTFAGVPAVYLNALTGRGVHVVTVNDYLAKRDADWMGPLYDFLGVSVGVISSMMPEDARRAAYASDATYGTNAEFGFDYLRDNMAVRLSDCVQRGHYFCIVDEVDSILIDEARTPLIISGVPEAATDTYYRFARIVPTLKDGEDYDVDEKHRAASPTESGVDKVEKALGIDNLYLDVNGNLVNHLIQALKAHALYRKDKEYIVRDGELLIVDEFTGRVLEGRRYSEGLHQALEAKEGLRIREENQTLATITLQNYFRMYEKLSGMTGTAATEANEFAKIYKTDVVSIPTHRPMIRADENDYIFKTKDAKFRAVADDIAAAHERGQPVLVGTISVEISEMLAGMLTRRGIPHNVLNAKNHAREAEIILDAGQRGGVTIATNMAGRGVDIKLGEGVAELGGLYIIGTERHESRRIDNQLRGRAGRQGDPGASRFYLSAEDDLIRIFAGDRIFKILDRLGPGDDLPIEAKMLSKTVEGAQKKVEEQNFNIRKRVLDYDDVLNKQREVIYSERRRVLEGEDLGEQARDWIAEALVDIVDQFGDEESLPADWDLDALFTQLGSYYPMSFTVADIRDELDDESDPLTREELLDRLEDDIMAAYEAREADLGVTLVRDLERWVLLQLIDQHWREHLYNMDYLREGIHLRALGQKDPLSEYRLEGHTMFDEMMDLVKMEFVRYMFHIEVDRAPEAEEQKVADVDYSYQSDPIQGFDGSGGEGGEEFAEERQQTGRGAVAVVEQRVLTDEDKVGRNDPCPCGSGKKYKRCHGA